MRVLVDVISDWVNAKLIPALAGIGIAAVTEEVPVLDAVETAVTSYKVWQAIQAGIEVYEKANDIKTMIDAFVAGLDVSQDGQVSIDVDDAPLIPKDSDTYSTPVGY